MMRHGLVVGKLPRKGFESLSSSWWLLMVVEVNFSWDFVEWNRNALTGH
jgi:hypothetical protein